MTKQDFLKLLDRYLAGTTTVAENDLLLKVYQKMEGLADFNPEETASLNALETKLIHRFEAAIHQGGQNDFADKKHWHQLWLPSRTLFQVAASLLIILGFGIFYYNKIQKPVAGSQIFGKTDPAGLINYKNQTAGKVNIYFSDRSYVVLESGSCIVYEKVFSGDKRKVYLQGTAFFQVTKNHAKPFLVFTDRLVTKVLGTSFIVKSGVKDAVASVTVVTGRVAVFNKTQFKDENAGADLTGGLLISPNHAVDLMAGDKMVKKLANNPIVVKTPVEVNFQFDNTPIAQVFDSLEKAYDIKIVYDQEKLKNCSLSVDMGHEDYFHKLDVICRTLNLSYKIDDGDVYISGQGCTN